MVPDTNLLLHGRFITEIKWRSIFKDKEFKIFIPHIVLKEIDKVKYSSKVRNKNRARKLISYLKRYDNNKELQRKIPLIVSPQKIKWDKLSPEITEFLERNEADHRIIAEIFDKYGDQLNDVYLITGDYTLLKLASKLGINVIDWLENDNYKEIFNITEKKEKKPSLPNLGVYFDDDHLEELTLEEISNNIELLSIDDLFEDSVDYDNEFELKYDVKEEIEELTEIYNTQLELINNHYEINLYLRNNCNRPYNDVDIRVIFELESSIVLTIKELIKKPVKPQLPEYNGDDTIDKIQEELSTGIYLKGIDKITRMNNLDLNLSISSEKKGNHVEWEVIYHVDRIKHNTIIALHPLLMHLPDKFKAERIILKINFTHEEPGKIKEQKRIIKLY
ncbi:MAG: PIN domain-containing protein [Promethearchaeota archaeon]